MSLIRSKIDLQSGITAGREEKERETSPFLLLFVLFVLIVIPSGVYLLGLPGGFEFDDGVNIIKNEHLQIESFDFDSLKNAALSSNSGPLRRPIPMLTFALNYFYSQESVLPYKLVNIAIHVINVVLVFLLTRLVLSRAPDTKGNSRATLLFAFGIALLWSVLPINLTSVLYVIQRMVSLGGAFALSALIFWMLGRNKIQKKEKVPCLEYGAFLVFFAFAVLCKETYALTVVAVGLLEVFLYSRESRLEKRQFSVLSLLAFLGSIGLILVLVLQPSLILGDFSQREFTMYERGLTQSRVLVHYLYLILYPSNTELGLYHDDFIVSHGLLDPITTLLSIAFWFVYICAVVYLKKRALVISLGMLWFLVWHMLESTIISLELVHEHRNYLASLGLIWVAYGFYGILKSKLETPSVANFAFLCVFLMNAAVVSVRAMDWSDLAGHALAEVTHHPNSVRAKYQLGRIHLMIGYKDRNQHHLSLAEQAFREAGELSDHDLLPYFGVIRTRILLNKEIQTEVDGLSLRLKSSKIPAATIVAFSEYSECIKVGECEPLKGYYLQLTDALLENVLLSDGLLSDVYSLKAKFLAEVMDDYDSAYDVMREGVQRLPHDFLLRKGVLYYYVINGYDKLAFEELKEFGLDFSSRADARAIYKEVCGILKSKDKNLECKGLD